MYTKKNVLTLQYSTKSLQCSLYLVQSYFRPDGNQLTEQTVHLSQRKTNTHKGSALSKQSLAHWMLDAKLLPRSTSFSWTLLEGHSRKSRELVLWTLDELQDLFSLRTNTHLVRTCWESSRDQMAVWQRHLLQMLRLTSLKGLSMPVHTVETGSRWFVALQGS